MTCKGYTLDDNNPKFIDLGLSSGLLWADRNIGADSTEHYGAYFAWGETSPKKKYSLKNWIRPKTQGQKHTGKKTLPSKNDVANIQWQNGARMPKVEDFEELLTECTWSIYGLLDYCILRITGPNGNSIEFPACGYNNSGQPQGFGYGNHESSSEGWYWSATSANADEAYVLHFYSNEAIAPSGWYYYNYVQVGNICKLELGAYGQGPLMDDSEEKYQMQLKENMEDSDRVKELKECREDYKEAKDSIRANGNDTRGMWLGLSVRAVKDSIKVLEKQTEYKNKNSTGGQVKTKKVNKKNGQSQTESKKGKSAK